MPLESCSGAMSATNSFTCYVEVLVLCLFCNIGTGYTKNLAVSNEDIYQLLCPLCQQHKQIFAPFLENLAAMRNAIGAFATVSKFLWKKVPGDTYCLFNAVAALLEHKPEMKKTSQELFKLGYTKAAALIEEIEPEHKHLKIVKQVLQNPSL